MIICEAFPYRDGPDVFEYRDSQGATPICRLARVGDRWEVLFYRGPSNRGPHSFHSRQSAERHLGRYLAVHGDKLVGPLNQWSQDHPQPQLSPRPPTPGQPDIGPIDVPKRRARRRSR